MAEITASSSNKTKCSYYKTTSRRSTRVDLTPMVDLGFLLITFFVFTTTMAEPKTLDLVETHNGEVTPVKQSAAMTIILCKNHEIYYYYGELEKLNDVNKILKTDFHTIRSLIVDKKKKTNPDYLMFIIKADKPSTLADNIDILDEMSICNIPMGHYAEVDITKDELELINANLH